MALFQRGKRVRGGVGLAHGPTEMIFWAKRPVGDRE